MYRIASLDLGLVSLFVFYGDGNEVLVRKMPWIDSRRGHSTTLALYGPENNEFKDFVGIDDNLDRVNSDNMETFYIGTYVENLVLLDLENLPAAHDEELGRLLFFPKPRINMKVDEQARTSNKTYQRDNNHFSTRCDDTTHNTDDSIEIISISDDESLSSGHNTSDSVQRLHDIDDEIESSLISKKAKKLLVSESSYQRSTEQLQNAMAKAPVVLKENSKKLELMEKGMRSSLCASVGSGTKDVCICQSRENAESVANCMNALEGVDGVCHVKATKYLHDDPLWREMFLLVSNERKRDWVLNN